MHTNMSASFFLPTGGGFPGFGCHGAVRPVLLLDHPEDQPEGQREGELQVHRYPRHLRLRELRGQCCPLSAADAAFKRGVQTRVHTLYARLCVSRSLVLAKENPKARQRQASCKGKSGKISLLSPTTGRVKTRRSKRGKQIRQGAGRRDRRDPGEGPGRRGRRDPGEGPGRRGRRDPGEGPGRRGRRDPGEGPGRRGRRDPGEGQGRRGRRDPGEGQGRRGRRDPGEGARQERQTRSRRGARQERQTRSRRGARQERQTRSRQER